MKGEYKKTKKEWEHYSYLIDKGLIKKDSNSTNFLKKLEEKKDFIRVLLMKKLMSIGINGANDTMEGFFKLLETKKNDHAHRMKTEYSYDVQDHH